MTSHHADALGKARTAADFAAVIDLLDTDLGDAVTRKHELQQAEDRAIFGDGDLAAARKALDDGNAAIALLEKTIDAADKRRAEAATSEARADIAALGEEISARTATLGERWRSVHRLVEQLRQELFEADALARSITTANGLFDAAGVADLKGQPHHHPPRRHGRPASGPTGASQPPGDPGRQAAPVLPQPGRRARPAPGAWRAG